MKITPLGDSALTIRLSSERGEPADDRLRAAWATRDAIASATIPGVREVTSSYESVSVFFDLLVPLEQGIKPSDVFEWFTERVISAVAGAKKRSGSKSPGKEIEIPVCFHGDFAPDLSEAAANCGMTTEQVADLFCRSRYIVAFIGFSPGFPYLVGLPSELVMPRRATPRIFVPAGSVAIGGNQAGIYPLGSPGGWNVIGRTPLQLFDPGNTPPSLLTSGDVIHFKNVSREDFDEVRDSIVREK